MKPVLVLAQNRHQFINFIRHYELNANDYRYILGDGWGEICGYHWDTPVIMLEQWQLNKNYVVELMKYIGHRFNHIGFLSEGEMYNDN
jgi:hypothetical protein